MNNILCNRILCMKNSKNREDYCWFWIYAKEFDEIYINNTSSSLNSSWAFWLFVDTFLTWMHLQPGNPRPILYRSDQRGSRGIDFRHPPLDAGAIRWLRWISRPKELHYEIMRFECPNILSRLYICKCDAKHFARKVLRCNIVAHLSRGIEDNRITYECYKRASNQSKMIPWPVRQFGVSSKFTAL